MDLHGIRHSVYWTQLASNVFEGASTITVVNETDWVAGDEVVITTTSYDPWHTETFAITAVDDTGKILTLNGTLKYGHLGRFVMLV